MTINKLCSFEQAGLRNFYVVAGGLLAELWRKDSWFGFALMVPAKKRPRRAFVGGGVMTDDRALSQKERYLLSSTSKLKGDPQEDKNLCYYHTIQAVARANAITPLLIAS